LERDALTVPFYLIVSPFTGALHWKVVSVYINRMGLVKMISVHELVAFSDYCDVLLNKLWPMVFAGDAENEEPACRRDDHQEEEK
jgi:hypothetical protein